MSCSICRLPFVPHPKQSSSPHPAHFPPQGLLTKQQYEYFNNGIGISGAKVPGVLRKLIYFSGNMFGGKNVRMMVVTIVWESQDATVLVMHTTCADFLRRVFGCEDTSLEEMIKLCEIEEVIGSPQGGRNAGRLPFVRYEDVGEKIDLRPFWKHGGSPGMNTFDWNAFKNSNYNWLLIRPDVFPKFTAKVEEKRLPGGSDFDIGPGDALANLPMDLFNILLPYLSIRSYLMLTSTCRLLRYHALTTLQPHARKLVIGLGWAMPTQREYAAASEDIRMVMASEEETPFDADWLLYLSRVHRSKAMRVRRWIWVLCEEVKRVYEERLPDSPYALTAEKGKTSTKKAFENKVKQSFQMYYFP